MTQLPYRDFSSFLAEIFPFKVQKITIDAGFTCPNRDGLKGIGGCTYCNNQSFSPNFKSRNKSITTQLQEGVDFFSHKEKLHYLAYFQSYTNTYERTETLIAKYEEALAFPNVEGLIIGTRPDCMPHDLLAYFEELNKRKFVMIEYGVESTLDCTLDAINRGHSYQESVDTIIRTAEKGIRTGAHMILGLPGESNEEILQHATKLSELPLTTIKLHQLQLIKGTVMAKQYRLNPDQFRLYTADEYIDLCIDFVQRLHPNFVVERFISQSPKQLLIAPDWGLKNFEFTAKVLKRFQQRNAYQGKLWKREL